MKKIVIIFLFTYSLKGASQNNAAKIFKADTLNSNFSFFFNIENANFSDMVEIELIKVLEDESTITLKNIYISPFNGYFLSDDSGNKALFQNTAWFGFAIDKRDYADVSIFQYKIHGRSGSIESYNINKP